MVMQSLQSLVMVHTSHTWKAILLRQGTVITGVYDVCPGTERQWQRCSWWWWCPFLRGGKASEKVTEGEKGSISGETFTFPCSCGVTASGNGAQILSEKKESMWWSKGFIFICHHFGVLRDTKPNGVQWLVWCFLISLEDAMFQLMLILKRRRRKKAASAALALERTFNFLSGTCPLIDATDSLD